MATLKICWAEATEWITNVTSIMELDFATLPRHCDKGGACSECDSHYKKLDMPSIFVSHGSGRRDYEWPKLLHVGSYDWSEKEDTYVKLLWVEHDSIGEGWIVPSRNAFLMSDTGTTIDRI